jgi:hypothetical protein
MRRFEEEPHLNPSTGTREFSVPPAPAARAEHRPAKPKFDDGNPYQ